MVPLCVCGRSRWREQRRLHRYSHVLADTRESLVFRDHVDERKAGSGGGQGAGSVSMETSSMDHNESSRPINPRTKGINKRWRVRSSTRLLLGFFPSFFNFSFLNCRFFWVVCCIFSVTILISKLEVQSHRKSKCLCLVCQDATNKK